MKPSKLSDVMSRYSMKAKTLIVGLAASLVLCLMPVDEASAFYSWQGDIVSGETRGLLRVYGMAAVTPNDTYFYTKKKLSGIGESARLLVEGQLGERLSYDINILQSHVPDALLVHAVSTRTVERYPGFNWQASDSGSFQMDVDRLNLRWSQGLVDITLGRQAINLATTFYFTPNDFFIPFSAQTFDRVYKPGVDAARVEVQLGELSQLSLISVLGYEVDPANDTGWGDALVADRASWLARVSTVKKDVEWSLLAGRVRENNIIGGALQGDIFDVIGVRAEGNVASADNGVSEEVVEWSFGLDYRWANSLHARFESFYHGGGATAVSGYAALLDPGLLEQRTTLYMARHYTALGLGYEFSPLLRGEGLVIANHIDHSQLLSFNAVYSLADEADMYLNVALPMGDGPVASDIKSEYGLYPRSINLEMLLYF